jgi:hypothetical protein
MRIYLGKRIGARTQVFVQADEHSSAMQLTNSYGDGSLPFDWGYEGEGPAVLAHSLLVDAVGLLSIDVFFEHFMVDVVAKLSHDQWQLSQLEILDYAKRKYIDDKQADLTRAPEERADELLQHSVSFVKEMQALAWQSDFSKDSARERLLCDSEDEKSFSPWYHIHPKADQAKDQIAAWLKECEEELPNNS